MEIMFFIEIGLDYILSQHNLLSNLIGLGFSYVLKLFHGFNYVFASFYIRLKYLIG